MKTETTTPAPKVGSSDLGRLDDVLLIRCIRHISVRQQNTSESTGAECGGCIAEDRDRLRGVLNDIEDMCHRLAFGRAATTTEIITALREMMNKANTEVCDGGRKTSELKQDADRRSQH